MGLKIVNSSFFVFLNIREISKEIARIEQQTQACLLQLADVEKIKSDAENRKDDLLEQIANEKTLNFEKEKEFNDLTKQNELEKEKEVVLQSDKLEISTRVVFH